MNKLTSEISLIQGGISDKVGLMIQFSSSAIVGFAVAFYYSWELTLVITSVVPIIFVSVYLMSVSISEAASSSFAAYSNAGSIAQQVLSSMRTVISFGGQESEIKRYGMFLNQAEAIGTTNALSSSVGVATVSASIYLIYALGFWYGNSMVPSKLTPTDVVIVFISVVYAARSMGNITPNVSAISQATVCGNSILSIINQKSEIDPLEESGLKPDVVLGNITFRDVKFHYPSRPDIPILQKFSLEIPAGKTIAFVGTSGCGKSTILKLLERFYDPVAGDVSLDGCQLKEINVQWLREQIGMVSQEPVLFNGTIRDNLRYGLLEKHKKLSETEIENMMIKALKDANAWDFISNLSKGIDTFVGGSESMLSGGQKQRIAIARATLKDPKILLLDEATSALDADSEKIVQTALDSASKHRTTICIAHRLSTVRKADIIIVMKHGIIIERGTHMELIENGGIYSRMVDGQRLESNSESADQLQFSESELTESVSDPAYISAKAASFLALDIPADVDVTAANSLTSLNSPIRNPKSCNFVQKKRKSYTKRFILINRPEWSYLFMGLILLTQSCRSHFERSDNSRFHSCIYGSTCITGDK